MPRLTGFRATSERRRGLDTRVGGALDRPSSDHAAMAVGEGGERVVRLPRDGAIDLLKTFRNAPP